MRQEKKEDFEESIELADGPGFQSPSLKEELDRSLKFRYALIIAVAGCFGTGLFIGSGATLYRAGPLSSLIGYIAVLSMVWTICEQLSVLSSWLPVRDGLPLMTKRYLSDAFGFTIGWHVWFIIVFSICNGLTASALVIRYWTDSLHSGLLIFIMMAICILVNCFGVEYFSQINFWLTNYKVAMLLILCITGIVVMAGGNPAHHVYGFKTWKDPGPMRSYIFDGATGKFLAILSVLVQATFTLGFGPELVSIVSGEVRNPSKYVRYLYRWFFYIMFTMSLFGMFVIGVLIPYNDKDLFHAVQSKTPSASSSPYVIAFQNANIKVFPHIINATILITAFSAAVSVMYSGGQWLQSLAANGNAPSILAYRTRNGKPIYALSVMFLVSTISFVNASASSSSVFMHLLNMLAMGSLLSWLNISVIYYRFMKAAKLQNINVAEQIKFELPFGNTYSYLGMGSTIFIMLLHSIILLLPGKWSLISFITGNLTILLDIILFCGYSIYYRKTKSILRPLNEINLSRSAD